MSGRSYEQFCGIARALDLVGERWALLVVRGLLIGPKRFSDLARDLPGVATNVLAARLRELERDGMVRRRTLPPPAASTVYELTPYGRELEGPLLALGRWGAKSMGAREPGQSLRSGWLAVALKAYFQPEAALRTTATYELRLDDGVFGVHVDRGRLEIEPGPAAAPDLALELGDEVLIALLAGRLDPDAAAAEGLVRLEGDSGLLPALLELIRFPRPEAA